MTDIPSMFKTKKAKAYDKIDSLITDLVSKQISIIEQNMLFKSVLNIGNVYIVDIETHTILFANDNLKEQFGKDIEGQSCHKVFQDLGCPCSFCTNPEIISKEGEPHYWIYFNKKVKQVYIIADVYTKLKALDDYLHIRFEIAIPVTNQMKYDLLSAWENMKKH